MYKIAHLPNVEREILFQNTANKMGLNAAIIEKDFWVCLVLDYLFQHSKWKNVLAFKGGTSLSKVYNVIERFSEDIDLILDWRVIGYGMNEPWEERSNTQQQKFIDDSRDRLFHFLKDDFLTNITDDFSKLLGISADFYISDDDAGTVKFRYPQSFKDGSILQEIRLEIGALAAWTPTQKENIKSYAAEMYPEVFEQAMTEIIVTTAERTFWEKATILHQEANRPKSASKIPLRYSRHYYDLYSMAEKGFLQKALEQPELLEQVAEFKMKFYPRKWAEYESAKVGSLKLYPAPQSIDRLRDDYKNMRNMIYGDYPEFDEILEGLKEIEKRINGI